MEERRERVERAVDGASGALLVLAPGLLVSGVVPPLARGLARCGHHRGHQHEKVDRDPGADERGSEAAQRLCDHDEIGSVADGADNGVGVVGQSG